MSTPFFCYIPMISIVVNKGYNPLNQNFLTPRSDNALRKNCNSTRWGENQS